MKQEQSDNLQQGADIIRFSQLPRKGLLADFSQIGLEQLIEFRTNNYYDLTIYEMQLEHIKQRAKELSTQFVVYQMISINTSVSDSYIMKFTQNALNPQPPTPNL